MLAADIGHVIGRKGETVQSMRDRTGATIKVHEGNSGTAPVQPRTQCNKLQGQRACKVTSLRPSVSSQPWLRLTVASPNKIMLCPSVSQDVPCWPSPYAASLMRSTLPCRAQRHGPCGDPVLWRPPGGPRLPSPAGPKPGLPGVLWRPWAPRPSAPCAIAGPCRAGMAHIDPPVRQLPAPPDALQH